MGRLSRGLAPYSKLHLVAPALIRPYLCTFLQEGPLTQPPSSAGGRDSDIEGPSDHELAARFANLDLGCGFF